MGGDREVLLAQLSSLDQSRFDLGILTLGNDLDDYPDLIPDHVTRLGAPYRPDYGYGVLDYLSDGLLLRAARRYGAPALAEMERFAPHVLHFQTNPRQLGLGILAERQFPTALVFTDQVVRIRPDDYSPLVRRLLRIAYRRLYRRYHVISAGPSVARFNREAGFMNPARSHLLLENRIDVDAFHPRAGEPTDEPLTVVFVGRIFPIKGVDTLIRAFAGLRSAKPVRLQIVGPDLMDGEMEALAAGLVVPPLRVEFLGVRSDVPALLSCAAIGVLPSRREGLSVALLELMASGLAVVVSDIPENLDVVSHGDTGFVVPLDDTAALTSALQTLVDQPELRRRLGGAARAAVMKRTSADPTDRLAEFYEAIASPLASGS